MAFDLLLELVFGFLALFCAMCTQLQTHWQPALLIPYIFFNAKIWFKLDSEADECNQDLQDFGERHCVNLSS